MILQLIAMALCRFSVLLNKSLHNNTLLFSGHIYSTRMLPLMLVSMRDCVFLHRFNVKIKSESRCSSNNDSRSVSSVAVMGTGEGRGGFNLRFTPFGFLAPSPPRREVYKIDEQKKCLKIEEQKGQIIEEFESKVLFALKIQI